MFTVNIFHQKPETPLGEGGPPPSYQATSSRSHPVYVPVAVPVHIVVPQRRAGSVAGRFIKALLFGFCVWVLLKIAIWDIIHWPRWPHQHHPYDPLDPPTMEVPRGFVLSCDDSWEELPSSEPWQAHRQATKFVSYPVNMSHLLFLGQNAPQGKVTFKVSKIPHNTIQVNVVATYRDAHVRDLAHLCFANRDDGAMGVGIFNAVKRSAPQSPPKNELSLDITVTLPFPRGHPTRLADILEINMPHTSITFEEFPSDVHFGTVSVGPRGGAFDAKNLAADSINVDAANEPITGIFNVTSLLALVTSNAPVDVVIGLENDDQDYTTAAILKTSNGPIQATIDLLKPGSSRSPSHGGKYYVIATTTNERLDINFPTSPVEAILQVHGNTTNDAASVSLNPAYEGSFQLGTSNELVHVEKRRVTDPSGMGRKRGISIVYARAALVYGEVAWGKMPDEHGNVHLTSSNGEVVLNL